ncbi:MAG: hypothetical protein ACRCZE_01070 [Candidatus Altimarinota bacterium]
MNRPRFGGGNNRRRNNNGNASRYQEMRQNLRNSPPSPPIEIPKGIIFYCRTCENVIDMKPTTFDFRTPVENCQKPVGKVVDENREEPVEKDVGTRKDGGRDRRRRPRELQCDIVYGTERSIKRYFKIPDSKYDQERREREEKAAKADKF